MNIDFLSAKFPAEDITDGQYLYRSLGSFWTQLFTSKNELKGYTTGMAEEAIQAYYNLVENIQKYSIKDIGVLHKEKWLPLVIKKSEYNKAPFVFEKDGAVFGSQPVTDLFYGGQLFRFGEAKHTDGSTVYSFSLTNKVKKFNVIADRIIAPQVMLISGVDVILKNNVLFFNKDIFNDPSLARTKIITSEGAPSFFKDDNGALVEDEFVILWLYNAELDEDALYTNFGTLLDVKMDSSQAYKDILISLMNLYVEGPTISALNKIFAVLAGCPTILGVTETVEDIYEDTRFKYVITDKNVYRINLAQEIADFVQVNAVLQAGDILTNDVLLIDSVIDPVWWLSKIETRKLAFASYVFNAEIKAQLFFENTDTFVTCDITGSAGSLKRTITFPVTGRREDVDAFHAYINKENTTKDKLLYALGLLKDASSRAPVNPLNFILSNFLKNNTLLLKMSFTSEEQMLTFLEVFPTLDKYLPPHVYVLVYVNFKLAIDSLDNLNNSLTIPGYYPLAFSCDGSSPATGARPGDVVSDPEYYKDYRNRIFCISVGPYKELTEGDTSTKAPLHVAGNLAELSANNSSGKDSSPGIKCGVMRTEIPESVLSPGEDVYRRPTTREVPSILLIDF